MVHGPRRPAGKHDESVSESNVSKQNLPGYDGQPNECCKRQTRSDHKSSDRIPAPIIIFRMMSVNGMWQ